MSLLTAFSDVLKRFTNDQFDSVDKVIRESDAATVRKLEAERKAQGPQVAALAAAQVAADAEKRAKEAETKSKIAKAAAKSASKRAKHYKKEASRAASRASAAEVDAAAKAAESIRVSQTAAVDEVEQILSENQKNP